MIQAQTLNKILQEKDSSIITLNNITTDYFSEYPDEFSFIKNHIIKYGCTPDLETFVAAFPDFPIIKVDEPTDYLLDELLKDKNARFLAANYNKMRDLIMNNDIEGALGLLKEAADTSSSFINLHAVDILSDTSRFDSYVDKIDNYDKYFIKTGFDELDKILGGWDTNEELATIVARNGLGKSWVLFKCAAAAAMQGKCVGIYSGEMSENKVGYRIDTLIGHIANGALVHGSASVKTEYERFLSTLKDKVPGKLKVLTPKMINGAAGVSALRAFIEKENLDILFIDQHSLLEDDRKAKNPIEKASNISKDLKLLQVLKRIPIISVSQQNRSKADEGKTFDTTQVSQSDRIAQDSTVIIFIERENDLMKLHLVKSRDTENGKVLSYKVDLNTGNWIYVDENQSGETTMVDSNSVAYSEDDIVF